MRYATLSLLAVGMLAGCQDATPLPAQPGDLVPLADVKSAFDKGRRICYNYDPQDGSCTAVGRESGQTDAGFSFRTLSININATNKIVGNQFWLWQEDRWCEDVDKWRDAKRSLEAYDLADRYARLSPSEAITQDPTMRAAVDEDRALADKPREDLREICIGWRLASVEPWSATQVVWIDGTEQTGGNVSTVHLFPQEEADNLLLRYERSESF